MAVIAKKQIEPDDMMNVEDMDWYKEEDAKDTPGRALRFFAII